MKKILCVVSKDVIRRNIYATDFWPTLIKSNPDTEFHLLVEGGKTGVFEKEMGSDNVVIHEYDRHPYRGKNRNIFFLVRTGINSHSTRLYRQRSYAQGTSSLKQLFIKGSIANTVGRFGAWQRFVRKQVQGMDIDSDLKAIFDEIKPDLVFAPSLIDNDYDVPVSVEARNRGIRVIGMVRSWDNLNNHGVLAFLPDRFIVQNKWLIECAEKFQGVKRGFIKDVISLPHYDLYKDPAPLISEKEKFFNELGLDTNKKLILLGGSDFYYTEDFFPKTLDDLLEQEGLASEVQVFFRPHPSSGFSREDYKIDETKNFVLDGGLSGKTGFSDTEKLVNLFHYSDIIMNICSTLSIDAAVFNTPAICVNFDDERRKLSKWENVNRLYDSFDHYERLVETGGAYISNSKEELMTHIKEGLNNPNESKEARQRLLDEFVEPFDGNAGKRLADIVTEEIRNLD